MDNIDKFLDALDHPERYSRTELETIIQDPEVKEVFNLLDKTKSSLCSIPTPEIDEEWKSFKKKRLQPENNLTFRLWRFLKRNAAASIITIIASVTAVAAIVGAGIHRINSNSSEITKNVELTGRENIESQRSNAVQKIEEEKESNISIIVFDNETLDTIMTRLGGYYDYQVFFANESLKSLRLFFRWNKDDTIEEVIERLNNFEQINISVEDKTIKID